MKEIKYQGDEEILIKGINILLKKLGPVETTRFLNIPRKKRLESVKRHREWQKALNKDNFLKELFSE
jgi:bifunctional DNA-binding transcriptional regulator/antitoxin component of YhaV-PrlF toxin-antitoxin module